MTHFSWTLSVPNISVVMPNLRLAHTQQDPERWSSEAALHELHHLYSGSSLPKVSLSKVICSYFLVFCLFSDTYIRSRSVRSTPGGCTPTLYWCPVVCELDESPAFRQRCWVRTESTKSVSCFGAFWAISGSLFGPFLGPFFDLFDDPKMGPYIYIYIYAGSWGVPQGSLKPPHFLTPFGGTPQPLSP